MDPQNKLQRMNLAIEKQGKMIGKMIENQRKIIEKMLEQMNLELGDWEPGKCQNLEINFGKIACNKLMIIEV